MSNNEKAAVKLSLRGQVKTNYKNEEGDRSISIWITPEQENWISDQVTANGLEWSGDRYPCKVDEEKNMPYFKSHSRFEVPLKGLDKGYTIDDIGKESDITILVQLKEGSYRGKKYVSAYLSGIQIHTLEQAVEYNPFDDEFATM